MTKTDSILARFGFLLLPLFIAGCGAHGNGSLNGHCPTPTPTLSCCPSQRHGRSQRFASLSRVHVLGFWQGYSELGDPPSHPSNDAESLGTPAFAQVEPTSPPALLPVSRLKISRFPELSQRVSKLPGRHKQDPSRIYIQPDRRALIPHLVFRRTS
jgi:hypothetical protein